MSRALLQFGVGNRDFLFHRGAGGSEVVSASQAVCPSQAIVFGDINDPNSRAANLKASPLNYGILTELNTHPRTTCMARVRNA